jgi:hypothetical protein
VLIVLAASILNSAQQMDATFSSAAQLEVCTVNDDAFDMRPSWKLDIAHRYADVCTRAHISVYFPECTRYFGRVRRRAATVYSLVVVTTEWLVYTTLQLSWRVTVRRRLYARRKCIRVRCSTDPFITHTHAGHVLALAQSPLQTSLVATGAGNSEVYMWDVNAPDRPMSIGPKQQPYEQVVGVDWNHKVAHILVSLTQGRAHVWDLRKQDGPIMVLADVGTARVCVFHLFARTHNTGTMEVCAMESG